LVWDNPEFKKKYLTEEKTDDQIIDDVSDKQVRGNISTELYQILDDGLLLDSFRSYYSQYGMDKLKTDVYNWSVNGQTVGKLIDNTETLNGRNAQDLLKISAVIDGGVSHNLSGSRLSKQLLSYDKHFVIHKQYDSLEDYYNDKIIQLPGSG
jgi:hypothetical protein